jgi:hypothetical protein
MTERLETNEVLERIEELLRNAKPVPLTGQVRLDAEQLRRLLAELREALGAERRGN